jgi:hypothetical protein
MSILLIAGITLIGLNIDLALTLKNYESTIKLDSLNRSCFEDAIYRIRRNSQYSDIFQIGTIDEGCTATVSIDLVDPNVRNIVISSYIDLYHSSWEKQIDISQNPPVVLK